MSRAIVTPCFTGSTNTSPHSSNMCACTGPEGVLLEAVELTSTPRGGARLRNAGPPSAFGKTNEK
eukprot:4168774-Alexandrium_andersonii.AAC.1